VVENRITEAIARGDFDNLPGAGNRSNSMMTTALVPEENASLQGS